MNCSRQPPLKKACVTCDRPDHRPEPVAIVYSSPPIRRAFTLVELLVVLGIVVVLISLLMPVFSRVREAADRTNCLSNLRQINNVLHLYALANQDRVPIGYRTVSKQYNSMVFTTSSGGQWVLFGFFYNNGYFPIPASLFCPSESNPKFLYNTPDNPWPAAGVTPTANIQSGYAFRPNEQIPDDLTNIPVTTPPFVMPKLSGFGNEAILSDLTASANRIRDRHVQGINVLFGDGSAHWVNLSYFKQPEAVWPDATVPPSAAYNATQDVVWSDLDRQY